MSTFNVSEPAMRLLRSAGIDPTAINEVFYRRAAARAETFLRPGHPHPVLVRRRTGIPLMTIARRRRHFYITVEWREPLVRYVEYARGDCRLLILGDIPETAQAAALGGPVGRLVSNATFIAEELCAELRVVEPFTEIALRPRWLLSAESHD